MLRFTARTIVLADPKLEKLTKRNLYRRLKKAWNDRNPTFMAGIKRHFAQEVA